MRLLALLLIVTILYWGATSVQAASKHRLLENTESPDHLYAVGWGLPGKKGVNWEKLHSGDEGEFESLGDFTEDVENYLIDLKNQRILHPLPSQYWSFPDHNANHRSFEVVWTPSNDLVLVLYSLRFNYGSFAAYRIAGDQVAGQVELGKQLETAFRNYLRKTAPTAYHRSKESLVYWFDTVSIEGDKFFVQAIASLPKSDREEDLSATVKITFSLAGMKLSVIGIEEIDENQLLSLSTQEALAKADKLLNASYKFLRSKLSAAAREKLRIEQVAWLSKRDKIPDVSQRTQFIEARTAEMNKRAKSR